ncbi:hypothetical protein [Histidinibacterium lentulum]|uniref:Uncharacterized protein n=1 Tax=Histidinibacterium lentulum TaxID=2480588 RepID=A0A3N2R159_9RHOB|nr:hypothetical protein [Histidinibacterium lentulum]ROU01219.1 hypothetical protein EAT49_11930 [Histidinibacterium lentulum]
MTWPVVLFLALQGVFFLAWVWLAFHTLFRLRAMAAARSGRVFPGPAHMLTSVSDWIRDPAEAERRRLLVSTTAVLLGLSAVSAIT